MGPYNTAGARLLKSLESTHIVAIVGRGWLRKALDARVDEYLLGEALLDIGSRRFFMYCTNIPAAATAEEG